LTPAEINRISWPIYARPLRDGSGQILHREFRWWGPFRRSNILVVASPGFIWDGASIPRAAWSFIGSPFRGRYQQAALVHDILYEMHDGTDENTARQMWLAVRVGGSHAWRA
jgi:hypothetical protein